MFTKQLEKMFPRLFFVVFLTQLYWLDSYAGFLEEVCMLDVDEGHECKEDSPHLNYYFNVEEERCHPFTFKGCAGNSNRFILQDDCIDSCQVDWFLKKNKKNKINKNKENKEKGSPCPEDPDEGTLETRADCDSPPDKGPCRALINQWYFSKELKKCVSFMYGGCKGNSNRYNTECQCKKVCVKSCS